MTGPSYSPENMFSAEGKDYFLSLSTEFDKLNDMVNNLKLPENTESTEIGTQVRVPDKWITIIPAQVSTANGAEVEPSKEIVSVNSSIVVASPASYLPT